MNYSFDNIEYRPFPGHNYRVGYATRSGVWHVHGQSGDYRDHAITSPIAWSELSQDSPPKVTHAE